MVLPCATRAKTEITKQKKVNRFVKFVMWVDSKKYKYLKAMVLITSAKHVQVGISLKLVVRPALHVQQEHMSCKVHVLHVQSIHTKINQLLPFVIIVPLQSILDCNYRKIFFNFVHFLLLLSFSVITA